MKSLQGWRSLNKVLLVLIFGTCFLGNINLLLAQSTCSTPTQISGFGVDGDIHANSPASVLGDSWFLLPSFPGPGIGVIGSGSGTATPALTASQFNAIIQAGATSQDRNRTYLQRMAFPYFTQINGHTLIDAFSARDNISPDTTAFAGSNKNGDNPANWSIATSAVPNKNDIIDVGGHLRRSGVDNKLWMFAYVTKLGTSGDSYTDIEIYRQVPQLNLTTGSIINTGPAATGGHTSFTFLSNGAIANSGDVLVCLNYNSTSGVASLKIWCNINNLDGNGNGLAWFNSRPNRPFNLTGDFITGANANGYGYAEAVSLTGASCLVYSVLNTASAPASYWGNLSGSGAIYSSNLDPEQMVNIAINFTDFGLDGSTATGPCSNVFGALLFKTRSSSSFSSELKDVTGPFEFANFSEVQANAGPDKVLTCSSSSITLNGSSLTPGASVIWTALNGNIVSGANSFTPVVNQVGTYVMSVQSPTIGTCIARDTLVVTLNNTAPAVSAGSDKTVNCSLSTTSLSGSSPIAAATYSWSALSGGIINSGATTPNPIVGAGCYVLTVTDPANGCSATDTVCVNADVQAPTISVSSNIPVSCFAGCDGSVEVNATGLSAPFSYLWSNGATVPNLSGLCADTYTVTVTGSNGCTSNSTITIQQPTAALQIASSSVQNVDCNGSSTGNISVAVTGGTSPYAYQWSNGSTTTSTGSVPAGSYQVTVTDANGCIVNSNSIVVNEPASPVSANASSIASVSCFGGSDGSINVSVSGGTSPYNYQWSNGSISKDLSNVAFGSYTLTVTDANGCTFVLNASVSQPPAPLVASTITATAVTCFGGSDGAAQVLPTGGTAPYGYSWSSGSTAAVANGLSFGSYSVIVTDANGCSAVGNVNVQQPSLLSASATTVQAVSCNGGSNGSINVSVVGGVAPYTYLWSNGSTLEDQSGLSAGSYSLTATDANGCIFNLNQSISEPNAPVSTSLTGSQNISCFGLTDGSINVSVSGGTPGYTYVWSNGSTTSSVLGLAAGTFTVTATDANGCQASNSYTLSQPSAPLSAQQISSSQVSCFGGVDGSIDISVSGGTAPYSYAWSNGSTTEDISSISAGVYTVTVTDVNGCTSVATSIINEPAAPLSSVVSAVSNVNCQGGSDGSATITVSGGTAPYLYAWSNGANTATTIGLSVGTYSVLITDANGCTLSQSLNISEPLQQLSASASSISNVSCFGGANGSVNTSVLGGTAPYSYQWSNGSNSSDINGLSQGAYTVTITDANGCSFVLNTNITQPSAPLSIINNVITSVSCNGGVDGAISLIVVGGTAPYTYNWSNGSSASSVSGLANGSYSVTVTDANGCVLNDSFVINQPAAALSATSNSLIPVSCNGGNDGAINVDVSGGTAPYAFAWSNGANTEDLVNLQSGTYTVTVTDANGCETNLTANIQQPQNPLASSAVVSQQVNCFSGNDGSIDLSVSGGTSPYNYSWSNGAITEDLSNLSAGTYSVNIIDANGCQDSVSVVVSQPQAPLTLSASGVSGASCFGTSTGVIDLTVNGGTGPYSYSWSNGAVSEDLSGLAAGTYSVTVVDINGCQDTLSVIIDQPQASLAVSASNIINVDCFGNASGSIDLNVGGGTQPYTYQWSNGSTSEDLSGLSSGSYTVSVVDANGCDGTLTITIQQPSNPLASTAVVSQQVNCFNGSDGSIDLSVSGGTQPYTYAWSNGSITEDLTNLAAGTYTVNIIDANGCLDSVSVVVSQPLDSLSSNASVTQQVSCFGGNDGSIDLTINGGTAPYGVAWSNGAITQDISGLAAGTYTVDITDANGCTTSQTVVVQEPAQPLSLQQNTSVQVSCFGGNDGSIDITAFGGTAPYDFQWSNGEITEDVAGLSAGSYTLTITDANGCTLNQSFVINQPTTQLAVSGTTLVGDCINNIGGDINLIVGGGTAPYSYNWSNGATTQNLNNLPSASYTVTVTDANGCIDSANFVIANNSFIYVQITDPEICVGDSALLEVSVNVPSTYQWYYNNTPILGAINDFYFAAVQGFYKCEVNSVCGIIMSDSVEVAVRSVVGATISSNQIICPPDGVELVASGGVSYQWSPSTYLSDPNASNPFANPRETTTYSVLVTDDFGCTITMSVDVTVICDTLLIPNGFSPNGDGVNDGYEIEGIENFPGNILYIYNRWGNLIYKAKDYQNNWTGECNVSGVNYGQKVPAGTYYYILDLNDGQKPRNGFLILRK
jgi:gliding motility-associated-like protein